MARPGGKTSEAYDDPWEDVEVGRKEFRGIDVDWYGMGIEDLETMVLQRDLS